MEKTFDKDYVIADTHIGHDRIVGYCNRPENHDEIMIREWRNTVGPNDRIYHLGDVSFYKEEAMRELVALLPGYKVLILGNHDRHNARWYLDIGFDEVFQKNIVLVRDKLTVVLSHYPIEEGDLFGYRRPGTIRVVNIHGHVHNNGFEGTTENHRNVSVEVIDYRPQLLEKIISEF